MGSDHKTINKEFMHAATPGLYDDKFFLKFESYYVEKHGLQPIGFREAIKRLAIGIYDEGRYMGLNQEYSYIAILERRLCQDVFPALTNKNSWWLRFMIFVGVITGLCGWVQASEIIITSENAGVSFSGWVLEFGICIAWLSHGIKTKDKPILVSALLSIIGATAVIILCL